MAMIPAAHALECADIATSSDDYARRFSGEVGAWLIETQSEAVTRLLRDRGWKTALDVGGGHGQLIQPLRALGIQTTVLGSDAVCKTRLEEEIKAGSCSFSIGALTDIPFAPKSFELATCIRFISHCEDWKKLIQELCRVASRGVLIDYPPLISSNLIAPLAFQVKKRIEGNTRPFSIFTHREIEDQFKSNGFTLERRIGQFFFPMAVHRLLKNRGLSRRLEALTEGVGLREKFGSPVVALFVKNS